MNWLIPVRTDPNSGNCDGGEFRISEIRNEVERAKPNYPANARNISDVADLGAALLNPFDFEMSSP